MEKKFTTNAYRVFLLWGILSALGTAVSTFVDAVLIGNFIGSEGLAVTNIATPVFLLLALLGTTLAVGANVMIGKCLGQSDVEKANHLFHIQIAAGLVVSIVCVAVGMIFSEDILYLLGATEEIIGLAKEYTNVVFLCGGLFIFYHILSFSVRSDGDPKIAAIASAVLIVLNIVLDLFFLGVMKTGIMGASLALCIATLFGVLTLLRHFTKKCSLLHFQVCMPEIPVVLEFVKNGFGTGSAFLFQAIIMGIFNQLLIASGDGGTFPVAFFSITYTMSTFAYAIFDGSAAALTPVVSIVSGERDADGIEDVVRLAFKIVIAAGLCVTAGYSMFSVQIIRFFGIRDPVQMQMASDGFRIFSLSLVFAGVNTLVTSFWQSISRARLAGMMSVIRNFILMLFLGISLIPEYQTTGLSMTYLCCEGICTIAVVLVLIFSNSVKRLREEYSVIQRTYEKAYVISKDSISQISADLEQVSDQWEIDMRHSFFINLMVEEIVLNIIKFGLDDKGNAHYIAIKLLENQDGYIMRIRDDVSGYNPFETDGDEVDNAVIRMIKEKSKYYDYQRKLIFNYLYLEI